jgi:hypothetical protein
MKAFLLKTICCGGVFLNFSPAIAQTQPAGTSTTIEIDRQSLQLIDAGAEPRRELKFSPAANSKQSLTMNVESELLMSIDGKSIQSNQTKIVMKMDLNVKQVAANGDIDCEYIYTKVDLAPMPEMSADLVKNIRDRLATVVGTRGNVTIDRSGQMKKQTMTVPANIDPTMKKSIESSNRQMESFSAPLPSEKIGKGASWKINRTSNVDDIKIEQTVVYKIVELSDRQIEIESKIQQTAPQQSAFGGAVKLNYMSSSGGGRSTFKFDSLLPIAGTVLFNTKNQVETTPEKDKSTVKVDTNMKIKMDMTSP